MPQPRPTSVGRRDRERNPASFLWFETAFQATPVSRGKAGLTSPM
jgi:hypothetical protein